MKYKFIKAVNGFNLFQLSCATFDKIFNLLNLVELDVEVIFQCISILVFVESMRNTDTMILNSHTYGNCSHVFYLSKVLIRIVCLV
jgi:hypothetical protein